MPLPFRALPAILVGDLGLLAAPFDAQNLVGIEIHAVGLVQFLAALVRQGDPMLPELLSLPPLDT